MGRHIRSTTTMVALAVLLAAGAGAEQWTTTLTVENGCGASIALSYGIHPDGTLGLDPALGEVGLPPWPPTAVFEARFIVDGLEGLALDIRDDSRTGRTHRIQWQAGGCGYPVVLRWDASALPPATFTMQDGYTGTLIPAFDMAQTDSLVIPAAQSYIKRVDITVLPGELPPGPPVITPAIPDQSIFVGQRFAELDLDDFVDDPDDPDEDLDWTLTGSGPPWVTLNPDRILDARAPEGWTGSATFTLRVIDPGGLQDEQEFRLEVLAPGLPSWTIGLTVTNAGLDSEALGVGIHRDAGEGIDPDLGEVALPPWPPTSVFDARCLLPDGLTHSRLDLRGSVAQTIRFHLEWQAGSGGYPVTVTWPADLPLGEFRIRDDLGGIFLPSLDMRATQSLVVPDSLSFIEGLVIEVNPVVDTTPPSGPEGLDVNSWSPWDQVTLDWSAYPCTEENFAYFEILFDTELFAEGATHSWDWSEDGSLGNRETTFTTVALPGPADRYVFRIRAWDVFGNPGALSRWCIIGDASGAPLPSGAGLAVRDVSCAPNPFNPATGIRFTLGDDSQVIVDVYDARGRLVRRLGEGLMRAGPQVLAWDGLGDGGAPMPSGTYLCRIEAGSQVVVQKMTLLK